MTDAPRFFDVVVEPDDHQPESLMLRFKIASEARPIARLRYSPEDAPDVDCDVFARAAHGAEMPALAVLVEDSSAGWSTLVVGGLHGLRLHALDGSGEWFETHLLLPAGALP